MIEESMDQGFYKLQFVYNAIRDLRKRSDFIHACKGFVAPLIQERDTLFHLMKGYNPDGKVKMASGVDLEEIKKAEDHYFRAFYDIADYMSVCIRQEIDEYLSKLKRWELSKCKDVFSDQKRESILLSKHIAKLRTTRGTNVESIKLYQSNLIDPSLQLYSNFKVRFKGQDGVTEWHLEEPNWGTKKAEIVDRDKISELKCLYKKFNSFCIYIEECLPKYTFYTTQVVEIGETLSNFLCYNETKDDKMILNAQRHLFKAYFYLLEFVCTRIRTYISECLGWKSTRKISKSWKNYEDQKDSMIDISQKLDQIIENAQNDRWSYNEEVFDELMHDTSDDFMNDKVFNRFAKPCFEIYEKFIVETERKIRLG